MKPYIEGRTDVELLVNTFYTKVRASPILGYIFDDLARVDWESHLPKMYSFWATLLLDERSFSGNPMVRHMELSKSAPMTTVEFSEWIRLFTDTVDELFEGGTASEAKLRAANIARLMQYKIETA
jgi:hemoglobin